MAISDPATRIRVSDNSLSQMIGDGWEPDEGVWHLYLDDGEFFLIPTFLNYEAGGLDGFTRIAQDQTYNGHNFDVFKRNLSLL